MLPSTTRLFAGGGGVKKTPGTGFVFGALPWLEGAHDLSWTKKVSLEVSVQLLGTKRVFWRDVLP